MKDVLFRAKDILSQVQTKLKRHIRENWGYPFVVAFMILLFSAAIFLSIGSQPWINLAESISVVAYFALVVGVILQLAYFLRNQGKNGEVFLDGPD